MVSLLLAIAFTNPIDGHCTLVGRVQQLPYPVLDQYMIKPSSKLKATVAAQRPTRPIRGPDSHEAFTRQPRSREDLCGRSGISVVQPSVRCGCPEHQDEAGGANALSNGPSGSSQHLQFQARGCRCCAMQCLFARHASSQLPKRCRRKGMGAEQVHRGAWPCSGVRKFASRMQALC